MAHWEPQGAFEILKKRISSTIKDQFPVEGKKNDLVVTKVWVDDNKHIDDIRGQMESKLRDRTWSVPVRAEFELRDKKTGKVKDRQALTLAQLPKITNRYTYIVGGNEWQVNNMFRLKSGVYTHIKENGELASQWNLAKGLNFNMDFKPKTKEMTIQFSGKGANIPLYPVLKTLGVDDDTIERAWGKEILTANKKQKPDVALRKFYKTFKGENPETLDQAKELIIEEFGRTKMRPEATKLTLGRPFDEVTGKALLAGSDRILKVSRGEAEQDDRDSLQFKDLFSAEDLIAERMVKKHKWDIKRKLGNNVDKQTKIKNIVNPDIFGKPVKGFFTQSTLTERPDQMNPMSYISGNRRTTIRGEGGIAKAHQVTMAAKAINPSHTGFLDPIQTPESEKIGTTLQLAAGVRKKGNEIEISVINAKTGKSEWIGPGDALRSNLAYPDQYTMKDGKPSPTGKLVKITDERGQTTMAKPKDVDYIISSTKGMFDLSANLIPYLQNNQGNRTMVAAKQIEQAVSLTNREAPLVRVKAGPRSTFEDIVGGFTAHTSPVSGKVLQVKKDGIIIRDDDGQRHEIQIYNDFPLNDDKSLLTSTPLVKKGDSIKKGQIVADNNFTKDGTLALGTSLNVAYMPYKGYNFEDGIVISDSAAKKLTSEHMFRSNISQEKNTILDKKKLRAEVGSATPKAQLDKLDDDAVIREGEEVAPGDILIGALKHEELTPEKQKMALFGKGRIKPVRPQIMTWDKEVPGKVVRVTKHGKRTTVYVKAQTPADIGDKIVGRHGNKGIITSILPDHEMPQSKEGKHAEVLLNPTGVPCYDEDTEFLTTDGWVKAPDISMGHKFATLNRESLSFEFQDPEEVYHIPYEGKMYRIANQQLDMLVTPNHKQFTAKRGNSKLYGTLDLDDPEVPSLFELKEAREIVGQPRRYLKAAKWEGTSEFFYYTPSGSEAGSGKPADGFNANAAQWAEFMGWYLSEGSAYFNKANYGYIVEISQNENRNPENYERIATLLEMLGLNFERNPSGLRIKHKGLYEKLAPLGKARDKFVPREILDMSMEHLHVFLDALIAGDGSETWNEETGHYGCRRFWTSSEKLADGIQEVAAKLGIAANIKQESRRGEDACYYISLSGSRFAPWMNWSSTTKANQVEEWLDYDGVVHCATVPNGTLLVRRNGKAVFSGNTRINLGQVLETAASKIAKKTGKPYLVDNFDPNNTDYTRNLKKELDKLGLSDTEEMFDPTTKRSLGKVLTGDQYIYKLHHTAAKGLSARSRDAYDSNMTPRKGGPHGGQTMDAMGLYAMLAHNARENVREMQSYKCFLRRTTVETEQGPMLISKLVNQKVPVKVLSWNEERGLEYQPILNYLKRRIDSPLVKVEFMAKNSRGEYKRSVTKCTDGHKFYTPEGEVAAKDLEGRTLLTPGLVPNFGQLSVLVGSLLGDGCLTKGKHHFPTFQERHSIKQREYLEFKAMLLGDFSARSVRDYSAGEDGFNVNQEMCEWGTLAQPSFMELFTSFYDDGKKRVPENIAEMLDPVAIAIWYQDDGSLTRGERQRVVKLHTGSFDEHDRRLLIEALEEKVGVTFTESPNNDSMDLRLGKKEDIDQFFRVIAPFVHPSMAYKVDGPVGESLDGVMDYCEALEQLVEVPVLRVSGYGDVTFNDGQFLYNIEVAENHNYFANRTLVGNSDFNDDFWAALQAGESVPTPKTPFVFKKFEGHLKAMGIDVNKQGNDLILTPLTDKKTLAMSNGELKNPGLTLIGRNLKPEIEGIFDPEKTGTLGIGALGDKWTHISLAERMPNPVFETPIKALLGLSTREFNEVVKSKADLGGKTGPKAIVEGLKSLNLKKEKETLEKQLPNLRTTKLNKANKKLKYIRALERANMNVQDAYTMRHVPVLPPTMRPVSVLDNGSLNLTDVNKLYTMIANTNEKLKEQDPKVMPEEEADPLRAELYDGLKSLTLTGAVNKGRHLNSIATFIAGKGQPKEGFFQDKIIGRRQDLSMRGTIVPEPSMSLDEVGIPRKAAQELYKPFVVRRLVHMGTTPLQAQKQVKENTVAAQKALEHVANERPLLLKRDPVLHKFGVQAFRPRLVEGKAIKIHPLVTSGYNADFDGDKMSAFVPVSNEAVKEAFKMFPSNNLFSPSNGNLMFKPGHESMLGLFKLTETKKGAPKHFKDVAAAARAVKEGKIDFDSPISLDKLDTSILEKLGANNHTTVGRLMVYSALPKELRDKKILSDPLFKLDKKNLQALLTRVGKKTKGDFSRTADKLKDLGNEYATGLSIGLEDFFSDKESRDPILKMMGEQEAKIRATTAKPEKKEEQLVKLYSKAGEMISKKARTKADASNNRMYDWVRSGARGTWDQFKQMTVAPMLVADARGKTVPIPIAKSYSEGLDIGSYWASMHGARMGTISRVEGTWRPGLAGKQIMQTTMDQMIVDEDCGTSKGLRFSVGDRDLLGRYTIGDVKLGTKGGKDKGVIPSGTLITPDIINRLKNNKVSDVRARSPLKCAHGKGICAKCYGTNEDGSLHPRGTNVGIIAAQALGEPATQLSMNAFHSGGVVGAKGTTAVSTFDRLDQLLGMPKRLPGSAVLASSDGEVERVQKDPAGGWNVFIKGQRHYVPGTRELLVRRGVKVKKGEAITSGPKNPREMLRLTGKNPVQSYIVDEIQKVYKNEAPLSRRNTETFVRALTNLSRVRDAGDHEEYLRGDHVPTSEVEEFNSNLKEGKRPVVYEPILSGVDMLPLELQEDWIARLQSRNLRSTVLDAASEGWRSQVHSTHPIPGMAYGKEFGKGTSEKRYLY